MEKTAKTYAIKEIYYTIQGEGYHTGMPAVFCRFSGCNLWSGLEKDRASAVCRFCDTDFWGTDGENGGKYQLKDLVETIINLSSSDAPRAVVFTGGEPALQIDQQLIDALHKHDIYICIETNGTLALPNNLDWVTVSPKAEAPLLITSGNELKLVYPQDENQPSDFEGLAFEHFYLQPKDDPQLETHTSATVAYCKDNPLWKVSLQTHKFIGLK